MELLEQPQVLIGLRVVGILVGALVLTRVTGRVIKRFEDRVASSGPGKSGGRIEAKRAQTLGGVLRATSSILVLAIAVLMSLDQIGFAITPLIAAAGIGGLAFGFGAQNLVRDVIAGFFILLENQYDVGDVVRIAGVSGTVEELKIRTTILRDIEGARHVIPNGEIRVSSNLTKGFSRYVLVLPISYSDNPDEAIAVAERVTRQMRGEDTWASSMSQDLTVLGVDNYGDSSIDIKCYIQTPPGDQWAVGRELRKRIKKAFDNEGISIPFPHRDIVIRGEGPNGGTAT
jgi:small conductance mechanosensitive channel